MKFSEALTELKNGKRITRHFWEKDKIFFQLEIINEEPKIVTYYFASSLFRYDSDIILSEDWVIEGLEGLHSFDKTIEAIAQGRKVKISSWNENYVEKDPASGEIIIRYYDRSHFIPAYTDFISEDWMIYE